MESIKKKRKVKKEKDLAELKSQDFAKRRAIFIVIILIIMTIIFGYSKYVSMKRVSVVKLAHTVIAGDVVNVETDFKKHDMLYSAYLEEGMMNVNMPDGSTRKMQGYVLWKDREKFQDFYFNTYQAEDSVFTLNSSSKDMQYKNPLIESMPDGNEEYVMEIDSAGININQLYPGTELRVRVSFEVPISLEEECRRVVANKTVYDGSSAVLKLLHERGFSTSSSGVDNEIKAPSFGTSSDFSLRDDSRTTVVSEVIFDKINAVDMISSSGESIYEVYMALLKMPVQERTPYLQTSFEEDVSGEFRDRITPQSVVLSLTRSEANHLHEFESMNLDTKWTIIKTATSSDMLKDFIEINNTVNNLK